MAKKPGTLLREYTEKCFVHLRDLAAEVEIYDGDLEGHGLSNIHYSVAITWYAGFMIIEATRDNRLSIAATQSRDIGTFFNSFGVTGYYVIKDTLKAVWDNIEYAVYTADINMETIYNQIADAAKKSLHS